MTTGKLNSVKYPSDMMVRWLTYTNDSAGLLDFEHKNFNRHYLTIRRGFYNPDMYLVSDGPTCCIFPSQDKAKSYLSSNSRSNILARITCENGKLFVCSPEVEVFEPNNEVLRVISEKACKKIFGHFKTANSLPIAINEGDEIRLGRVKLIVRHLAYNSSISPSYLHELMSDPNDPPPVNSTTSSAPETDTSSAAQSSGQSTEEEPQTSRRNESTEVTNSNLDDKPQVPLNKTLDSALSSRSKELNKEKSKKKNKDLDDNATVCDLSTSRTNLTTENTIQITDNLENTCRICLCDDDNSGPLITPCKCKGSLTYVHLSCIRSWIKGRLNVTVEGMPNKSYFWQKLTCELCGTLYPNKINIDNKEHDFVDIEQPAAPYLVLEPENLNDKGYFIVSLCNNQAVVGRGHDSDIRLTDISVSRTHSILYFDRGHFIIQDRRSKFGTLISSNRDSGFKVQISSTNPVLLKIGNGLLCITLKRPFKPFFCFSSIATQTTTFSL